MLVVESTHLHQGSTRLHQGSTRLHQGCAGKGISIKKKLLRLFEIFLRKKSLKKKRTFGLRKKIKKSGKMSFPNLAPLKKLSTCDSKKSREKTKTFV